MKANESPIDTVGTQGQIYVQGTRAFSGISGDDDDDD
jgi:hypothetical protein